MGAQPTEWAMVRSGLLAAVDRSLLVVGLLAFLARTDLTQDARRP